MNTLYRVTTTIPGMREPLVDWFYAADEPAALALARAEADKYGVSKDAVITARPATDKEMGLLRGV